MAVNNRGVRACSRAAPESQPSLSHTNSDAQNERTSRTPSSELSTSSASSLSRNDLSQISTYLEPLRNMELTNLGLKLGLHMSTINKMSSDSILNDMVYAWLRKDDDVMLKTGEPSLQNLAKALDVCGHTGIASEIRKIEDPESRQEEVRSKATQDTCEGISKLQPEDDKKDDKGGGEQPSETTSSPVLEPAIPEDKAIPPTLPPRSSNESSGLLNLEQGLHRPDSPVAEAQLIEAKDKETKTSASAAQGIGVYNPSFYSLSRGLEDQRRLSRLNSDPLPYISPTTEPIIERGEKMPPYEEINHDKHAIYESSPGVNERKMMDEHYSYHQAIDKEEAERRLRKCGKHCYLTRYSENKQSYILSTYKKTPNNVMKHFNIFFHDYGDHKVYRIDGKTKTFSNLETMLSYYEKTRIDPALECIGKGISELEFLSKSSCTIL